MPKKHLKGLETKAEVIENEITKEGKVTTKVIDGARAKDGEYKKVTREEIVKANIETPKREEKEHDEI